MILASSGAILAFHAWEMRFKTDGAHTGCFALHIRRNTRWLLRPTALKNIGKKWTMPIRIWKAALNRFTIPFDDSMPQQF